MELQHIGTDKPRGRALTYFTFFMVALYALGLIIPIVVIITSEKGKLGNLQNTMLIILLLSNLVFFAYLGLLRLIRRVYGANSLYRKATGNSKDFEQKLSTSNWHGTPSMEQVDQIEQRYKTKKLIVNLASIVFFIQYLAAFAYAVIRITNSEWIGTNENGYSAALKEPLVIGCLAFIIGSLVTLIIFSVIKNKIENSKIKNINKSNLTIAEGIVGNCKQVMGGSFQGKVGWTYKLCIAIAGHDDYLITKVKTTDYHMLNVGQSINQTARSLGMKKPYKKGDIVKVAFDIKKPKYCGLIIQEQN